MANTARKLQVEAAAAGGHRRRVATRVIRLERRLGDDRTAEREVEALPACELSGLPRPATLLLRVPGHEGLLAVATSRERANAEREAGLTVLDPGEWAAVVSAAEADRLWPADLRELCARKASSPGFVVDLDAALAGARPERPRGWTVGRVLARIGARLVHVEC